jgi:hypothetical protein
VGARAQTNPGMGMSVSPSGEIERAMTSEWPAAAQWLANFTVVSDMAIYRQLRGSPPQGCSVPSNVSPPRTCQPTDKGENPTVQCVVLLRRKPESSPIISAWVTLMPNVFDWRDYVRYGCGRNNYCDSGDCVARASRVKRGLSSLPSRIVDSSISQNAQHPLSRVYERYGDIMPTTA